MTLKQQDPACEIDVIAPAWSVPLLQRMPEVHQAIELPVGHKEFKFLTRYRLGRSLRARRYDRAIVTPRSFKSALVPFFAAARQRTGYRGEMRFGLLNDIRALDKSILTQTVTRYVALGLPSNPAQAPTVPFPSLRIDSANQQQVCQRLQLNTDRPIVGLMPGAEYGPAKQWPVTHYQQLATSLVQRGFRVWVFGSQKEQAIGESIRNQQTDIVNLCGQTTLTDVIDLLALTRITVSNDSGLMHIACATGRPVIGIYGSSDPKYTPPLSTQATILYKGLECSPCFERTCRFGHLECLNGISVDEVLNTILTVQPV